MLPSSLFVLTFVWIVVSFTQVYDDRRQKLKKESSDLRYRLREHKGRPKAIEMLRNSLNLSRTFLVQINNITDKDEIYTAKDLEELGKIINDTTVRYILYSFPSPLLSSFLPSLSSRENCEAQKSACTCVTFHVYGQSRALCFSAHESNTFCLHLNRNGWIRTKRNRTRRQNRVRILFW